MCLLCKHKDWGFILRRHRKSWGCNGAQSVTQRQLDLWGSSDSLANLARPMLGRDCPRSQGGRLLRKNTWGWLRPPHVCTHMNMHTQFMNTHTQMLSHFANSINNGFSILTVLVQLWKWGESIPSWLQLFVIKTNFWNFLQSKWKLFKIL